MKVAHVTAVFPPYKGGMGQVPYHHAMELHKLGATVEVLTPDYKHGNISSDFTVRYLRPWLRIPGFLGAVCPQLLWELRAYDVVQLHHPAFGMSAVVLLWKWLFGKHKKLIVFYHMDVLVGGVLGLLISLHRQLVQPLLLRAADTILVSSFDYVAHSKIAAFYTKHTEKFRELPFGVTDSFFPGEKNTNLLKQYHVPFNKKIILYVGGLGRASYFKGIPVLLHAASMLSHNDWHVVFVGKGDYIPEYKKLADELGITKKVLFTDWQADEAMPDWYRSADVFVLPSTDNSEAFGIVLVEALACAVPVVATNLPGVRSVVDEGVVGLLAEPGDADDLSYKLEQLLSNDLLRTTMSKSARRRVENNYLWSNIGKKLLQLYSE